MLSTLLPDGTTTFRFLSAMSLSKLYSSSVSPCPESAHICTMRYLSFLSSSAVTRIDSNPIFSNDCS